jgi:hypothetical protein
LLSIASILLSVNFFELVLFSFFIGILKDRDQLYSIEIPNLMH